MYGFDQGKEKKCLYSLISALETGYYSSRMNDGLKV